MPIALEDVEESIDPKLPLLKSPSSANLLVNENNSNPPCRNRLRFTLGLLTGAILLLLVQGVLSPLLFEKWASNIAQRDKESLFPPPDTAYAGPTRTGSEAFLLATATAQPILSHHYPLLPNSKQQDAFDFTRSLGHLSPQFSTPSFGLNASPAMPDGFDLTQIHILHRHGARYATEGDSLKVFYDAVQKAKLDGMQATGQLSFLNDWQFLLGSEILTPFGRSQLFNLGVKFRLEYGHLLTKMSKLPVFRSTTQDRMVKSSLNFAAGFFGIPYEEQYNQFYLIEQLGFNNTLCPDTTCPNAFRSVNHIGYQAAFNFTQIAFVETAARLQNSVQGLTITPSSAYTMLSLCAYETVALGMSSFCPLFNQHDFEAYEYAIDLMFHYSYGFGSPLTSSLGIGWVQELVSRLTGERLYSSNSATNATVTSSPDYFPLDQSIYVDATHDTTISAILVALNMTTLAKEQLPMDQILQDRSWVTSHITPFAANMVVQVGSQKGSPEKRIRFVLNDAVLPLTGIDGCSEDTDGFCELSLFVKAMKERIATVDFFYDCHSEEYPPSRDIRNGRPPGKY